MHDHDSRGARGSNLPPPKPPKLRNRHRYAPDAFQDGRDYIGWPSSWNGRAKHPRADRSNRLEPWGRDPETNLVIAPHGISPVSGTPRLTPATAGSVRAADLNRAPESSGHAAQYATALNKSLTEILERRFNALGFDPFDTLVEIAKDPNAENRDKVRAIEVMLPYIYARKKQIDLTSKTEKTVTTRYVIEIPAAPTSSAPLLDVTPEKRDD